MAEQQSDDDGEQYSKHEIKQALERARSEADNHNEEYAAGVRLSVSIIEKELFISDSE